MDTALETPPLWWSLLVSGAGQGGFTLDVVVCVTCSCLCQAGELGAAEGPNGPSGNFPGTPSTWL